MEDLIFDDTPEAVETAAPVEAEAPAEAQEPAVEQQEAEQQQESEREVVRKKKSASERIQEITWARHEAERRAAEAERQLAEFRAAKTTEPAAPAAGKPALDQFQDYDSYVEAVAEWRAGEAVRAALSANEQKTQAAAQAAQNKARAESWV